MKTKLVVAFDVDDTLLIEGESGAAKPNHNVIDLLRWFVRNDHKVIVWSGGGVEYALRWAQKFGLSGITVTEKGSVPVDIAVDDGGFGFGAEEQVFSEIKNAKVTLIV